MALTAARSITTAQSTKPPIQQLDVVIVNGRVMDPDSGLDAVRNIGISGDSIKVITAQKIEGRTTVDAKGLVVAPGFIDLHQHDHEPSDQALKALDGVTSTLELETGTADVDGWYAKRTGKALRSVLAVSSFRLRARLDLSVPSTFSGQRGCEPRFLDMAPLI